MRSATAAFVVSHVAIAALLNAGTATATDWHYGEEDHWPQLCQEGHNQSPIPLSEDVSKQRPFSSFIFEKYNNHYPANLKNNGHSAEIRMLVQEQPNVRGGGLPEVYILDHLHFHWQSEHTISNYRYPLELHLVHYASKYQNLSDALNYEDGVAVFAVLFDISPDDDQEFQPLITVIDKLHDKINSIEQMTFNIHDYIPRDTAGFYRYNGSLTTPGCIEGVLWTVFTNTLPISQQQVKSFSVMETADHTVLPKNYRSLQAINGREVYLKISPIRSAASTQSVYKIYFCSVIVVYLYVACFDLKLF